MGEISHTPPKSYFMTKNPFLGRYNTYELLLITLLIFIRFTMYVADSEFAPGRVAGNENDSNRHYSYIIILFIYNQSVQYSTVWNSIGQKVKKWLESTLSVKNICSASSVYMNRSFCSSPILPTFSAKKSKCDCRKWFFIGILQSIFTFALKNPCTTSAWSGLLLFTRNFSHNDMKLSYARLCTAFNLLANS